TATSSPSTPTPGSSTWRWTPSSWKTAGGIGSPDRRVTAPARSGSSPRSSAPPTWAPSPIRARQESGTSTPTSDGRVPMKTLGLIGGMSAESTTVYYQTLNRLVRERLGGLHSAQIALWSLDFAPIAELQAQD